MVALDAMLKALDLHVDAFAVCEVSRGWRLRFDADESASVHYGMMGSGVVRLPRGRSIPISQDSFVLLPPRLAHSFEPPDSGTREMRARFRDLGNDAVPRLRAGAGPVDIVTSCGRIRAVYGGVLDFFQHLNEPIVESFVEADSLRGGFQALLAEIATPTIGTRALMEAFLKQCLVLLLRRQARKGALAWLSALEQGGLADAVIAMVEHPGDRFTLQDLARMAGMSRSTFVDRFSAAYNQPPFDFLREVRLQRAAHLLVATDLPIKMIAKRVGFASRSYFSRTFSLRYGMDPTAFRRGARRSDSRKAK